LVHATSRLQKVKPVAGCKEEWKAFYLCLLTLTKFSGVLREEVSGFDSRSRKNVMLLW